MYASENRIATSVLVIGTGGADLRATVDTAIERRETRGCRNRSDDPELDPALQVNLGWSGPGSVERESIPPIPAEIAAFMREVSTVGKLVE
ncbi:hypothetical protein [Streptosporangium sp. NPDC000509]|uniref:hypothetical protein n=1 Tax=Streptosporangium sp. NPDC000509 TaxID=3366186 RepID=UPI00368D9529